MKVGGTIYTENDFASNFLLGKEKYPYWKIKFQKMKDITDCKNVICAFTVIDPTEKAINGIKKKQIGFKVLDIKHYENLNDFDENDITFTPMYVLIVPLGNKKANDVIADIKTINNL